MTFDTNAYDIWFNCKDNNFYKFKFISENKTNLINHST